MSQELAKCFVSHVESFGNCLRVWVQRDHEMALFVEERLRQLKSELQYGSHIPRSMDDLHDGLVCCARYEDGNLYRTEIQCPESAQHNAINALFVDYGNVSLIGLADIRLLNRQEHADLLAKPALAVPHYLSGVTFQKLTEEDMKWIKDTIQYSELNCTVTADTSELKFIKIPVGNKDLTQLLVQRNVGVKTTNRDIATMVRNLCQYKEMVKRKNPLGRPHQQRQSAVQLARNAAADQQNALLRHRNNPEMAVVHSAQPIINTLLVGSTHIAYITHVEDGPYSFSLQLKAEADEKLHHITAMINNNIPMPNNAPLLPGSPCLGRNSKTKYLLRAVAMHVRPDSCKVYYTDYGNCEDLPYSDIYQLPYNLAQFPALALRFSLANLCNVPVSNTLKENFKQLVQGKQVKIRVTNPEESPLVQFCEIFLNGRNIKELLLSPAEDSLPPVYTPQYLPKERDVDVIVSHAETPSQFYVQYMSERDTLGTISVALASYCTSRPRIKKPYDVKVGQAVCSLYKGDNMWYRGEVVRIGQDGGVLIFYVDYGNHEVVPLSSLVSITRELVISWSKQALECCLEGYDGSPPDALSAEFLNQTVVGKTLTLRLKAVITEKRILVDLLEPGGASIAKVLNDVLARSKTRKQHEPKLTVTYDGNKRSVTTCEPGANKYQKERFGRPQRNQYSEHDNRMEVDGGRYNNYYPAENRNRHWNSNSGESEKYERKGQSNRGRNKDNNDRESNKSRSTRWNSRDSHESNESDTKWAKHNEQGGDPKRDNNKWGSANNNNNNNNYFNRDTNYKGHEDEERGRQRGKESTNYSKGKEDSNKFRNRWKEGEGRRNRNKEAERGNAGREGRTWNNQHAQKAGHSDSVNTVVKTKPAPPSQKHSKQVIQDKSIEQWDNDDSHEAPQVNTSNSQANVAVVKYRNFDFKSGNEFYVKIVEMKSPNQFYVRATGSDSELDDLRTLLNSYTKTFLKPLTDISNVGTPVLARSKEDGLLYRGVINQITNAKMISVLFVDYGVTGVVDSDGLYKPTDGESSVPLLAVRCTLADVILPGYNSDWSYIGQEAYKPYLAMQNLLMRVESMRILDGELLLSVVLSCPDGTTVSQALTDNGVGVPSGKILPPSKFREGIPDKFQKPQLPAEEVAAPQSSEDVEPVEIANKIQDDWPESLQLLVGQCLQVKITDVKSQDLLFVSVIAKDGLSVPCMLTQEQTDIPLQPGADAIMLMEEVLTDRAVVTLFDVTNGKLLHGENISDRAVSVVCPAPVVDSVFKCFISHIEGSTAYLQNLSVSNSLDQLLNDLFSHYETAPKNEEKTWKEGELCCAKSADGNWYRARVQRTAGADNELTVFYIDYGNSERMGTEQLRRLERQFSMPEMAVQTRLAIVPRAECPPVTDLSSTEFTCRIKRHENEWYADLTDDGGTALAAKLKELAYADESPESPFDESNSVVGSWLRAGDRVHVVVSHIDTPSKFWVHLADHLEVIENLQTYLQEAIKDAKDAEEGSGIFAALYPQDNTWYRAVASPTTGPDVVKFIDYGNYDTATLRKELPPQLAKPASGYAVPVQLAVGPAGDAWTTDAMQLFESFIENDSTTAEILSVRFKIVVDLKVGPASLSERLVESGHAFGQPALLSPRPQPRTSVLVLYSNSPNDFYVMEESAGESLRALTERLAAEAEALPRPETVEAGALLVAQFPEDGQWYRAKVLQVEPATTVQFIDCGNVSPVENLRRFPDDATERIPPFVTHCTLGIDGADESLNSRFEELTKAPCAMTVLRGGDPALVDLVAGQIRVVDRLSVPEDTSRPETEPKISVVHREHPGLFYVTEDSKREVSDRIAETLLQADRFDPIESVETGRAVAAKFDDGAWYRALVLSAGRDGTLRVRSLDNGKSATVTEYKALPDSIAGYPGLAVKCSLEPPEGRDGWSEEAERKFAELACGEFLLERRGRRDDTDIVDLIRDGTGLAIQLARLCPPPDRTTTTTATTTTTTTTATATATEASENQGDTRPQTRTVFVSHENSPSSFYIRFKSDNGTLDKIVTRLSEADGFEEAKEPSPGRLYCARSATDRENWYRCSVRATEPRLEGALVDSGIVGEVSDPRELPPDLRDMPALAVHCRLPRHSWGPRAQRKFAELIDGGAAPFECVFLSEEGDEPRAVELTAGGESVGRLLAAADVQEPAERARYAVTHHTGPDSFYVVDERQIGVIDEIAAWLAKRERRVSEGLQVGDRVGAEVEGAWYRARIVEAEEGGRAFRVFCYDVGLTGEAAAEKILKMGDEEEEEVVERWGGPAPMGKRCRLARAEGVERWDDEAAAAAFGRYMAAAGSSARFTVEVVEEGEPAVVRLLTDEGDLCRVLAADEERAAAPRPPDYKPLLKEEKIVPGSISGVVIDRPEEDAPST